MVGLEALALALILTGAGETVLLDFSADWCGPCRSMEPTIRRLEGEGYPIRKINIDQDPQAASRFGVTGVPCFVMLSDGQEVDRVVGAASHARLRQMFIAARFRPQASAPAPGPSGITPISVVHPPDGQLPSGTTPLPTSHRQAANGPTGGREQAMQATVRLRVADGRGHSLGTGTVIDNHGDEALVLTCGHLFRDAGDQGRIEVDLFAGGSPRTVPGQLISYDLDRDVGLVVIVPGTKITPMRVAPGGHSITVGQEVFSVGCDRGSDPTVQPSRITAIDKYLGPPNIEVAGQPVDGRSGGGLFTRDGFLIGVCNAADPADGEGIYAALPTVHWELDRIGQQRIYESATPIAQVTAVEPAQEAPGNETVTGQLPGPPGPVLIPQQMPSSPINLVSNNELASIMPDDMEVICIVRPRNAPQGEEKLFIFRQPSQNLLNLLASEVQPQNPNMGIALQTLSEATSPAVWPNRHADGNRDNGVRAQSADR